MITSLSNCLDVAAFVAAANFSSSTLHILKVELGAYGKPRNTFHWKKVLVGEGWISVVDCRIFWEILRHLNGSESQDIWATTIDKASEVLNNVIETQWKASNLLGFPLR